jgi:hypothetical protein
MKKLLFGFCLILGSVVAANAQVDTTSTTQGQGSTQGVQTEDDKYSDKEAIAVSELPSIVRDQLQGQDYSGWTTGSVYRKEKEGKTFYAVEMKKGEETKMVKFDAQGNKVKEKSKD